MSDQIVYLHPAKRTSTVVAPTAPCAVIGRQYQVNDVDLDESIHGICGGQDYSRQHGRILPFLDNSCYVWDVDDELTSEKLVLCAAEGETVTLASTNNIITSRFDLSHSSISEPEIIQPDSSPQLAVTVSFDFVFSTRLASVQLGMLSLVETECFAQLGNGERYSLRNSGEGQRVLYLADRSESGNMITPLLEASEDADSQKHNHCVSLIQAIPERLSGSVVETLTVLEQYTSYFMQRELPFSQENIWTPVCPPVAWGWSMRVGKRRDGDCYIARQKLLTPVVGHNGLEMPSWEGNQLEQ